MEQRKELSSDAQIIVSLINKQPQSKEELIRLTKMPESTFYRSCKILLRFKVIQKIENTYSLAAYIPLTKQIEASLLRLLGKNNSIRAEKLAGDIGKPWEEIEKITYGLFSKLELSSRKEDGDIVIYKNGSNKSQLNFL